MKYMGSKSRIASHILHYLQSYIDVFNIQYYIEPFVGGANVIDKVYCKNKIGADANNYLVALLNHVASGGELLESVSKELYDDVRNNVGTGKYPDWYVGNVGFLAGFNGRWFDGGYAVSGKDINGKVRDYYREAKSNLLEQSERLRGLEFKCADYKSTELPECEAVIYCDPPYMGTKGYENDTEFNHREFWDIVREWSKKHIVFVSEEVIPEDFEVIWEMEVSRSIKAGDKGYSTEKLAIHKSVMERLFKDELI